MDEDGSTSSLNNLSLALSIITERYIGENKLANSFESFFTELAAGNLIV